MRHCRFDFMCDMAYVQCESASNTYLITSIAGRFGGGSELLRDGDTNHVWSIIERGMVYVPDLAPIASMTDVCYRRFATFLAQVPWLGIYVGHIPGAAGPLNTLMDSGRQFAARRLARGSSTRDVFHYLVSMLLSVCDVVITAFQSNEDLVDKEPPPAHQLIDDGVLAVVAGSDTTSIVMISIFFCIAANLECYSTLQEEIDKYYPLGEDPCTTEHHRNMRYLDAVMCVYFPCCGPIRCSVLLCSVTRPSVFTLRCRAVLSAKYRTTARRSQLILCRSPPVALPLAFSETVIHAG